MLDVVWVRLLGPFEAEVGGAAVALGGPRQRSVLARLLAAGGEVVSTDRLIDDLWQGSPPPSALTSLRAYVSNLRRALEPDRSARSDPRFLISAPPGYAVRLPVDAVDATRFESLLREARGLRASHPGRAPSVLEEALGLWRGPAYAEFADEPWSVTEAVRLGGLRLEARESLIEMRLRLGDVAEAVPMAEAFTAEQPLREEGWRLLSLALWAGGRQADALAALRSARGVLAEEAGLDPGPALVELEGAVLNGRTAVLAAAVGTIRRATVAGPPAAVSGAAATPPGPAAVPDPGRVAGPGPSAGLGASTGLDPSTGLGTKAGLGASAGSGTSAGPGANAGPGAGAGAAVAVGAGTAVPDGHDGSFFGRADEIAALAETAAEVRAGAARTVLLTGDAGAGKSALLARLERRLVAEGWLVAVGRCPEVEGAPPAWAWTEVLRHLAGRAEGAERERELAPLLAEQPVAAGADAAAGRFLLHRAACEWFRTAAARGPLAVILDDLHAADSETLALLAAVAAEPSAGMLLVCAYRPTELGDRLRDALAVLARNAPLRLALTGLGPAEVAEVVRAVCAAPADEEIVAALTERTGGNPFYVWESARLLAGEGALVAVSEVPEGVRDVLRRRLARLPKAAVAVLRLVAVAGREAEVDVVLAAADADEAGVADALDEGLAAGLLTEPAPGRVRFTHVLVRDTLYQDLSGLRRARMHARYAAAIERLRPADLPALAHHYVQAASAATALRAVDHCVRAAELAERRYAHEAEAELIGQALEASALIPAGSADHEAVRADLLGRLLRAQVRAGAIVAARATRDRAVTAAEQADRPDLLVAAFTAWTVPTPWERRNYGFVDERAVRLLRRLLDDGDLAPADRCRLLDALTCELAEGDPAVLSAGEEAVRIARELDDPELAALTLTAEARGLTAPHHQERRGRVGVELSRLGADHVMPAYEWLGEHFAACAAAVRNDVAGFREHGARASRIGAAYQLTEPQAVDLCRDAVLAHAAGRFDEAARRYHESDDRLRRAGSPHAEAFLALALMSLQVSNGTVATAEPRLRDLHGTYGPLALDPLAIAVAASGRLEEARRLHAGAQPIRRDYFHSVFVTMRAMAVIALGLRDEAALIRELLLPERDRLAGAMTGSVVLRPVALTLGELDLLLGRTESAAENFSVALEVARAWSAPHWEAEARAALAPLEAGHPADGPRLTGHPADDPR